MAMLSNSLVVFFSFAVSHLVLIPCREVFILYILELQIPNFQYNPHSDFSADNVNLFPLKILSTSPLNFNF